MRDLAAELAGVSRFYLRRRVKMGDLRAARNPINHHWVVTRESLVQWMRKHGYPDELWLPSFQPPGGRLLVVAPAPDLPLSRLSGCDPTRVNSVLQLGVYLGTEPTWCVLVDFQGVGRTAALELAAEFKRMGDRPLLVAAANADEACQRHKSAELFDLVFTRPLNLGRLVKGLNTLRRSVAANAPRVAGLKGRFRKAGGRR